MSINSDIQNKFKETERLYYNRLKGLESELLQDYKKARKEIIKKLEALYSKMKGEPTLFQASQYQRLANLEKQIDEIIRSLNANQKHKTAQHIKTDFADGYYGVGYGTETSLQFSLRFGLLNPDVIESSIMNPLDRIGWKKRTNISNAKLANQVRSEITSGLIQGNSLQETARKITKRLGKHFKNDVMRIVQTESMRARSWGNLAGSLQAKDYCESAGVSIQRMWVSTLDPLTRDKHIPMDGKPEDEDGMFTFPDGTIAEAPRLSGVAEHDIRCRCEVIEVVDNETPKMRYDNELKKNIPYTTFSDYKASWIKTKTSPLTSPPDLTK